LKPRLSVSAKPRPCRPARRGGAAAAELAIAVSVLAFILVASTDFARVYYSYLTITNAAYNGVVYGSQDSSHTSDSSGIKAAALRDAGTLSPALTSSNVTTSTGNDADGNAYLAVTVSYTFTTIVTYPGIPHTMSLSRTVQMRVLPSTPS
jgi:Flp pilus assembly protein TadG